MDLRKCPNCFKELPIIDFKRKSTHNGKFEDDFVFCNRCVGIGKKYQINKLDFVNWFEETYPQLYIIYTQEMLDEGKFEEYDEHYKGRKLKDKDD